jgi:hypothetical protein
MNKTTKLLEQHTVYWKNIFCQFVCTEKNGIFWKVSKTDFEVKEPFNRYLL